MPGKKPVFDEIAKKMNAGYSKARDRQHFVVDKKNYPGGKAAPYTNEAKALDDDVVKEGYADLVKAAYDVIKGKSPEEQIDILHDFISYAIPKIPGNSYFPNLVGKIIDNLFLNKYEQADDKKNDQLIPQYVIDCVKAVKLGLTDKTKDPGSPAVLMLQAILDGMLKYAPQDLDPKDLARMEDMGLLRKDQSLDASSQSTGSRRSSIEETSLKSKKRSESDISDGDFHDVWTPEQHAVHDMELPNNSLKTTTPTLVQQDATEDKNDKRKSSRWNPFKHS